MEWGQITFWELMKLTGLITVPFILGKWLWKKAVTEEIQKVGEKADAAQKAAVDARNSVIGVSPLVAKFSQDASESLSKMSVHYAEAVKTTEEVKLLIKDVAHKTDMELEKQKQFAGKFAGRLRVVEEEVDKLKLGKVIVIGDKNKK